MNMQEIHARLSEQFGEAIAPWQAPATGDPRIQVAAAKLHEVCAWLYEEPSMHFDFLRLISAVDWTDRLSVVYHLWSYAHGHEAILSVDLDRAAPRVASVVDLWPTADWHERESWDLMGVVFEGHPDLRRMFMPEDWEGHPLRKDYKAPAEYHGVSNEV